MEVEHPSQALSEAVEILGARNLADARRLARIELWLARQCPVCRLTLRHARPRGAELRVRELLAQVSPWERDDHSLRLVAAWIVLHGW